MIKKLIRRFFEEKNFPATFLCFYFIVVPLFLILEAPSYGGTELYKELVALAIFCFILYSINSLALIVCTKIVKRVFVEKATAINFTAFFFVLITDIISYNFMADPNNTGPFGGIAVIVALIVKLLLFLMIMVILFILFFGVIPYKETDSNKQE